MKKIKIYFYNLYYDSLILLEDIFDNMSTIVNNHRRRLDGEKQIIDHDGRKVWR